MTKTGHNVTGFFFGIINGITAYEYLHTSLLAALATGYLTYKGSNAPDFLEFAWYDKNRMIRRSLIRHRTYTHWGLLWCVLTLISALGLAAVSKTWIYPLAFCLGAILHLLMDLPNPSGIPLFYPTRKRKSLKWWKSGENEFLISASFAILTGAFAMAVYNHEFHDIIAHPQKYADRFVTVFLKEVKEFNQESLTFLKALLN